MNARADGYGNDGEALALPVLGVDSALDEKDALAVVEERREATDAARCSATRTNRVVAVYPRRALSRMSMAAALWG